MTYYGIKARFNLRLDITARNPEHAWTRARATIALLRQQNPAGVTVHSIDFNGARATPAVRAAMRDARKNNPHGIDYDTRAELIKIWKAASVLDRRRAYLESRTDLTEHAEEKVDAEITALTVALRFLDAALDAREPIREALTGYKHAELDTDQPETPEGGLCTTREATSQNPRLVAGDGSVS
jgi:hypothetical protein